AVHLRSARRLDETRFALLKDALEPIGDAGTWSDPEGFQPPPSDAVSARLVPIVRFLFADNLDASDATSPVRAGDAPGQDRPPRFRCDPRLIPGKTFAGQFEKGACFKRGRAVERGIERGTGGSRQLAARSEKSTFDADRTRRRLGSSGGRPMV